METKTLKKIKISVVGSNGQVGQEFLAIASTYEYCSFNFFSKNALDITDAAALKSMIEKTQPDFIINCAAYTGVDKAESDKEACFKVNTYACKVISEVLSGSEIKLIHFSSDYIYNTYNGFPIKESDPTCPNGVYAQSKLEGEKILRNSGVPTLIIRTSWVISSFGNNFVKTMLRLGTEKAVLNVVDDQYGAPTYARHLVKAVMEIILKTADHPESISDFNDTYNYSNEGILTWFDLAQKIMLVSGSPCLVNPVPTTEYPTPAQRPNWSVLSKHKIKERYKIEIPHWFSALKECLDAIK